MRPLNPQHLTANALSIHTLHAQAKPPAFAVIETDVKDNDRYVREYAPKAQALTRAKGGKVLAASSSVATLEGAPAKRIALVQFASMDHLKAGTARPLPHPRARGRAAALAVRG